MTSAEAGASNLPLLLLSRGPLVDQGRGRQRLVDLDATSKAHPIVRKPGLDRPERALDVGPGAATPPRRDEVQEAVVEMLLLQASRGEWREVVFCSGDPEPAEMDVSCDDRSTREVIVPAGDLGIGQQAAMDGRGAARRHG